MNARRLTDQQKIDAVRRAEAGETRASIARSLGCSEQNIVNLLSRRRRNRVKGYWDAGKLSDQQKIEIVTRYLAGESTYMLGKAYGVSWQNIGKLLRRRNVAMRPPGCQSRLQPTHP